MKCFVRLIVENRSELSKLYAPVLHFVQYVIYSLLKARGMSLHGEAELRLLLLLLFLLFLLLLLFTAV